MSVHWAKRAREKDAYEELTAETFSTEPFRVRINRGRTLARSVARIAIDIRDAQALGRQLTA